MQQHPLFQKCASHPPGRVTLNVVPMNGPAELSYAHLSLAPADVEVVVTHFPCPDGYAAALAAFGFNPAIEFILVNHDQLATLGARLAGKRVLFLDIAPKWADLQAWSLRDYAILDHHTSTEDDLLHVPVANKLFRMDYSGCALAWHYFYGNTYLPVIFQAVQARDLFQKDRVESCDELLAGLHCTSGYCATCWAYTTFHVDHLLEIGTAMERHRWHNITNYVKLAQPRQWNLGGEGTRTWVVNCTDKSCISDTGCELVSREGCERDVALLFSYDAEHRSFSVSLRSLKGHGPDVSLIARALGGGGHRNSAGFTYYRTSIEDLFV